MIKNYVALFFLVCISGAAFGRNNILCKNMDTANAECVKIAQKLYETRADRLANAFVKTKKEKEGKIIDKNKALYVAKDMQSLEEFMESFKICGEISKTQAKAETCLDMGFMADAKKREKKR